MKKILFAILLGILMTACFSPFDQETEYRIEPELRSYVDEFYKQAELKNISFLKENLIVQFDNDLESKGDWGLSYMMGYQRVISIDLKYFEFYNKSKNLDRIETLIFHELGHTILNRKHTTEYSIMNPSKASFGYRNQDDRLQLINELIKIGR